jgi:hypothetical protein
MSMMSGRLKQSEWFVDPIGHALQLPLRCPVSARCRSCNGEAWSQSPTTFDYSNEFVRPIFANLCNHRNSRATLLRRGLIDLRCSGGVALALLVELHSYGKPSTCCAPAAFLHATEEA